MFEEQADFIIIGKQVLLDKQYKMSGTINNFLTAEKLFQPITKIESNRFGRTTPSKTHHYHLLNQSLNKSSGNDQSLDEKPKVEDYVSRIKVDEQTHSKSVESQRGNARKILKNLHTPMPDSPTEEEEAPNMEFIVAKSSKKYFDSCRSEGLSYVSKLEQILNSDCQFLRLSLSKIHSNIEQTHAQIADNIKEQLYRVVDLVAEKWKAESLQKFHAQEITYIGELYELNTQIDERYKQIKIFRDELDHQRMWKNRASDLLTSTYEADLIQLSKLCKKSVEIAEANVNKYWQNVKKDFSNKLMERQKIQYLREKIFAAVKQQAVNKNQLKSTIPSKQSEQTTISKYEAKTAVKVEEQSTAPKNLNRKIYPGDTTIKEENNNNLGTGQMHSREQSIRGGESKRTEIGRYQSRKSNANNQPYEQYIQKSHTFGQGGEA